MSTDKRLHVWNTMEPTPEPTPELIAWFDDFNDIHEFVALSNFYEGEPLFVPIVGFTVPTGEHAFAAMKAFKNGVDGQLERIVNAASPGEAKALGQTCKLRPDWEAVKYDVMMAVLRAKFTLDRVEGEVLLSTGNALLIEGTYWDDRVWGVSLFSDRSPLTAPGRNWLGTLLMARRAELKAEQLFDIAHNTGAYNGIFAIQKSV
jgi:ribA/ribD-fused uncharacterized protein